jgi:hypothetical protein
MTDYYEDCRGVKWTDPQGLLINTLGLCSLCLMPTHRIDVDTGFYVCDDPMCVDASIEFGRNETPVENWRLY